MIEAGGSASFGAAPPFCPYIVSAPQQRNGLSVTTEPIAGDLVVYDWNRDNTYDHVGIFNRWVEGSRDAFSAVEGNTGDASFSNGGAVMQTTRHVNYQGTVFVRVAE